MGPGGGGGAIIPPMDMLGGPWLVDGAGLAIVVPGGGPGGMGGIGGGPSESHWHVLKKQSKYMSN